MAGTYTSTGTYSNLTRLELEQLRKADFFAGGKGLTVGDSALAPEGVVGKGDINAEPYLTGASIPLDDVYSLTPPTQPGPGLLTITSTSALPSETAKWFGPQHINDGLFGSATGANSFQSLDFGIDFTLAVQPGDLLLFKSGAGANQNQYAVATINTVAVNTLTLTAVNNSFTGNGTSLVVDADTYPFVIVRASAVQLFAVPGSGPTGEEQTFLTVIPFSTLHNNVAPTLNQINADRIKGVVPAQYGLNTSVDRSDAVFPAPATFSTLNVLGYRVVLYPDNGTGTGPDLTQPITSLNPVIDPAIPAADQRFTIDYKAGIIRFSCAPKLGGAIKVAGGVNATTGRLNLYAVFWAVDQSFTQGAARSLHTLRSTNTTANPPGTLAWSETPRAWQSSGAVAAGTDLSTTDLALNNLPRFLADIPVDLTKIVPLLLSFSGGVTGNLGYYSIAGQPSLVTNATYDNFTGLWTRTVVGAPAAKFTFEMSGGNLRVRVWGEDTGAATWAINSWDELSFDLNVDTKNFTANNSAVGGGLDLGTVLAAMLTNTSENQPRLQTLGTAVNSSSKRTLLMQHRIDSGTYGTSFVRMYQDVHGNFEWTLNASWDNATLLWTADNSARSYKYTIVGDNLGPSSTITGRGFWEEGRPPGGGTWNDTQWNPNRPTVHISSESHSGRADAYMELGGRNNTSDGADHYTYIRMQGATSDGRYPNLSLETQANLAKGTAPSANTLYPKNICKAWGLIRRDPNTSIFNWVVDAGFNVASATYDSGSGNYHCYFHTAMAVTDRYIILAGMNTTNSLSVSPYTVSYATSYSSWSAGNNPQVYMGLYSYDLQTTGFGFYCLAAAAPGGVLSGSVNDSAVGAQFAVFGDQNS